jgi:hypothetical protein
MVHEVAGKREAQTQGLCADCVHAQPVQTSKGSVFLLCGRSKSDPSFPKYPRLPVLACPGYQRASAGETPEARR